MGEIVYEERNGMIFSNETEGATDTFACMTRHTSGGLCRCKPKCVICKYGEHSALHGSVYGGDPGSKPYAHKFTPPVAEDRETQEQTKDVNA